MGKFNIFIFCCTVSYFLLFLSACSVSPVSSSSFLILVVDSLGFSSVSCYGNDSERVQKSGFNLFCQSSIRFHHAYTPSVLAQPALASLLTGLYPYEHGVWSNGSHFLSSRFKTLPEEAIAKGYRSSFFSGGGAIWRKSGLAQGFEVFDDNIQLSWKYIYRSAKKNIKLFLNWLDGLDHHQPFFSILYFPDLQFPFLPVKKEVGNLQSLQDRSQWNVLDRSFYYLIKQLKKRKRWHSTYVILVGTKAQEKYQLFRPGEPPTWSLFSDNTKISLFVKGPSKFRKKANYGNVNTPVTLVDLGWTLFDLLGSAVVQQKTALSHKKLFPVISLKKYLMKGNMVQKVDESFGFQSGWRGLNWGKTSKLSPDLKHKMDKIIFERPLLMESGWPLWRRAGQSRFAIRKGPYLFIYDEKPKLYNSLSDRRELNALSVSGSHPNLLEFKNSFLFYFDRMGVKPWKAPDIFFTEKLHVGKKLFSLSPFQSSGEAQNLLRVLMKKNPSDKELVSWRAQLALRNKKWRVLKTLGKKRKNFYWQYVASRNLKEKENRIAQTDCEKIFKKKGKKSNLHKTFPNLQPFLFNNGSIKSADQKINNCKDKSLISLYQWIYNNDKNKDRKMQSRFFYFYLRQKGDQKISYLNQRTYLMWDTHFSKFQKPLLSDLFLHLPEHKKYLKIVQNVLY